MKSILRITVFLIVIIDVIFLQLLGRDLSVNGRILTFQELGNDHVGWQNPIRLLRLFRMLQQKLCNEDDHIRGISKLSVFEQACVNDTQRYDPSKLFCSHSSSLLPQLVEGGKTTAHLDPFLREFLSRCSPRCAPYVRANHIFSQLILQVKTAGRIRYLQNNFTVFTYDDVFVPKNWNGKDFGLLSFGASGRQSGEAVHGLSCLINEISHGPLAHYVTQLLPLFDADFPCQNYVFSRTPEATVRNEHTFHGLLTRLILEQNLTMFFLPRDKSGLKFEHLVSVFNHRNNIAASAAGLSLFRNKAWKYYGLPDAAPQRTCLVWRSNGRNPENFKHLLILMESIFGDVSILQFNSSVPIERQVRGFYSCRLLVSPHGSQNANLLFSQTGSYFLEIHPPKLRLTMYEDLAYKSGVHHLRTQSSAAYSGAMRSFQGLSESQCSNTYLCRSAARKTPFAVNLSDVESKLRPLVKKDSIVVRSLINQN